LPLFAHSETFTELTMPAAFYREAIAIALGTEDHELVPEQHPASFGEVAEILRELNPEQRCDAIYADWLLQLHHPGNEAQIQIRDLLLGQGAMDAHYLAELVQNADDAGAKRVEIHYDGGWLFFGNNGRPLSPLNLLGLTRFFIHSNGEIVGLTAETIGRFGIGFKACHCIAEEMLIQSVSPDSSDSFGFRIPICSAGTANSTSEPMRLGSIYARWNKLFPGQNPTNDPTRLGHCTPEFSKDPKSHLPQSLQERITGFLEQCKEGGVWFAMRLHESGRKDAEQRINQAGCGLNEIAPLFLRNLKQITVNNTSLRVAKGKAIGKLGGGVLAHRLNIELSDSAAQIRNERFIIFEVENGGGKWRLALPANSDSLLAKPDPLTRVLGEGGLYAFLPLAGVQWPHRCHLHIDLPPNLARSDWNKDQVSNVNREVSDLGLRMVDWLSNNTDLWHPDWQPSRLLNRVTGENQTTRVAREFVDTFILHFKDKRMVRSVWGTLVSIKDARELKLDTGPAVTRAWSELAGYLSNHAHVLTPLVPAGDSADILELNRVTTVEAVKLFETIRPALSKSDQEWWGRYVWAVCGCVPTPSGLSRSVMIERCLAEVQITRANGDPVALQGLAETQGRSRLDPFWHQFFGHLREWIRGTELANFSIYGIQFLDFLKNLATPSSGPTTWEDVLDELKKNPDACNRVIWWQDLPECPARFSMQVVDLLAVPSGDELLPIVRAWRYPVSLPCLSGVINSILPAEGGPDLARVTNRLQAWGLTERVDAQQTRVIENDLKSRLLNRLGESGPGAVFGRRSWQQREFQAPFRQTIIDSGKSVFKEWVTEELPEGTDKTLLMPCVSGRHVISRLPGYITAPDWLSENVLINFIRPNRLDDDLRWKVLRYGDLNALTKTEIGVDLLHGFPSWSKVDLQPDEAESLSQYFKDATGNWAVGHGGGHERRLNEFSEYVPGLPLDTADESTLLVLDANKVNFQSIQQLPERIANYPSLRSKTISIASMSLIGPDLEETAKLLPSDIPEELNSLPGFIRLQELNPGAELLAAPTNAAYSWKRGDNSLTIARPTFGFLPRTDSSPPVITIHTTGKQPDLEDGQRFEPVLAEYYNRAPEDVGFRKAYKGKVNRATLYRQHRDKILAKLVGIHATDMGYNAEEILRELLQNAESAYASAGDERRREVTERIFEVRLVQMQQKDRTVIDASIRHEGRAFNEPDKTGQVREDIARICSLAGEANYLPEEVGRFNRGFKSVFNVTNRVVVSSGPYDFAIEDLMILAPDDPEPNPEKTWRGTTFSFRIEPKYRGPLLNEEAGVCRALSPYKLAFLRNVDKILVREDDRDLQHFTFERNSENPSTVRIVTIRAKSRAETMFRSRFDESGGRRVGIVVEVDTNGLPVAIDEKARFFHRTFPLKERSDAIPFLIDGEFATDKGRTGIIPEKGNERIIVRALEMAAAIFREGILEHGRVPADWLVWVRWAGHHRWGEVGARFPDARETLARDRDDLDEFLVGHIPTGGGLGPANEIRVVSSLVYRLAESEDWRVKLDFNPEDWLDGEIAVELRKLGERHRPSTENLEAVLGILKLPEEDLKEVREKLRALDRSGFLKNQIERQELLAALRIADIRLSATLPVQLPLFEFEEDLPEIPGPSLDVSSLRSVISASEGKMIENFTLTGPVGQIVFAGLPRATGTEGLRDLLIDAESLVSRHAWHRLLCYACSLGARMRWGGILPFWEDGLVKRDYFGAVEPDSLEVAGSGEFSTTLDGFFETLIHREFRNLTASGEGAEIWRRVFYDFRKLHHYVYRNDFGRTILEVIEQAESGEDILLFLRSGHVRGSTPWQGVIGQSMTAPLMFLMREMRRLGVIQHDRFDDCCYFMNGYSRATAYRLGWITDDERRSYDLQSLIRLSKKVHECVLAEIPEMLPLYDLPLQSLALPNYSHNV